MTTAQRWRIHNPVKRPGLYYVFSTENDANTALLCLHWDSDEWQLDTAGVSGTAHTPHHNRPNN